MDEKTLVLLLEDMFANEGFHTKKEVGVGYGIADLVLLKKSAVNTKHCIIRENHRQFEPLLNEKYFKTLKILPDEHNQDKSLPFNIIAQKTHLSKSYLRTTILKNLEKRGYIKTVDNKLFFKVDGWLPIAREVVAIEAKLKNWKRGAIQANRYRAFASQVYLAIPKETEHVVNKDFLKKLNVGLIVIDANKKTKRVVLASKKMKPLDEFKYHLATEYFWDQQLSQA